MDRPTQPIRSRLFPNYSQTILHDVAIIFKQFWPFLNTILKRAVRPPKICHRPLAVIGSHKASYCHINHSLFWKNLAPHASNAAYGSTGGWGGGVLKPGPLADAINRDFGSLEELQKQFNAATIGIQGSGWGWLVLDKSGRLVITTTPNQDPVIDSVPIIGVDIWEHAFYLQYKNVKPDYLAAIWHVINFEEAEKRLVHKSANL
ncbi:hypothetical protein FRC20_000496 [Serendipita sp. 405]|nr:hypothetical protein FRC16_003027 [Serendipita sp. 398]KAG8856374.1 hypothetical protein FRC20_000496 [Serendipita sp. 405]